VVFPFSSGNWLTKYFFVGVGLKKIFHSNLFIPTDYNMTK